MIRTFLISIILVASFSDLQAQTQPAIQETVIDGVNVQPLIEVFEKNIHTLKKPVKVYHWFQGAENSLWTKPLSSNASQGFQYVAHSAQGYWQEFGKGLRDNGYGLGLYVATDPVETFRFGGERWVLAEIDLPTGFRFIDLKTHWNFTSAENAVLNQLKCVGVTSINQIFQMEPTTSSQCVSVLRTILKDILRIQAFNYTYSGSDLKVCDSFELKSLRNSAFVITDSSWIRPEYVRVFNSLTPDAKSDRIRIQSLFFQVDSDNTRPSLETSQKHKISWVYLNWKVQQNYSGYFYAGISEAACAQSPCEKVVKICTDRAGTSGCQFIPEIKVPHLAYPEKLSGNPGPFVYSNRGEVIGRLLWSDLEGEPSDHNLNEWVTRNLFGCSKDHLKN